MTDDETLAFDRDDDLNDVVAQLEEGDQVIVADRSLPLEVFDTDSERIGADPHETQTVYLEGRGGRVYRLRGEYGHDADLTQTPRPPKLELRTEGEWECKNRTVSRLELVDGQQIMSDLRAGEWLAEAGIDVR